MQYNKQSPLPVEKIISALSYITMGGAGLIWLILGAVMKQNLRPFIKYHIYQSIFLSILFFIASAAISFICNILSYIPIINGMMAVLNYAITARILGLSILEYGLVAFMAYLVITAFLGKFTYVPWVSDIIKDNV